LRRRLRFVSAAGNDANTCFVQAAPCKTLQRGINQTSPGGELRLLSSLVSNGFINKSLTVEGGRYTVVGTIAVNNASAIVRFRRLNLNGVNGFPNGFNLINGAAVHIEECSAERFTQDGILLGGNVSTELVISNSVSRDNGDEGLQVNDPTTAKVTIDNSRFEHNIGSGVSLSDSQATVSRSVSFGNFFGFNISNGSTNIVETIAVLNQHGFLPGGQVTLESSVAFRNTDDGVGTDTTVRISNSVFSDNGDDGVDTNSGTTLTLLNNLIAGNGGSNVEGTLTPLAAE
jgi:hypothetical protein